MMATTLDRSTSQVPVHDAGLTQDLAAQLGVMRARAAQLEIRLAIQIGLVDTWRAKHAEAVHDLGRARSAIAAIMQITEDDIDG